MDTLQQIAEERLARLRYLADALESHYWLTAREIEEIVATLRQLIEDVDPGCAVLASGVEPIL